VFCASPIFILSFSIAGRALEYSICFPIPVWIWKWIRTQEAISTKSDTIIRFSDSVVCRARRRYHRQSSLECDLVVPVEMIDIPYLSITTKIAVARKENVML
jgi:hypothetical protein